MMRYPVEGVYGSVRSTRLIGWDVRAIDLYRGDQVVKGGKIDDQPTMETILEKYNYNNTEALYAHYIAENLPNGVARFYLFKDFCESVDRENENSKYGGYNNIRIFRYADALLLYAEALVHSSGAGAGDQYVNLVRARAGMAPWTGATLDQIIEERGIELAQEWGGDRFFDLVRTGKTIELGSNFTPGEDEFFPTPQEQIDNHPGLVEDPVSGLFPITFGDI